MLGIINTPPHTTIYTDSSSNFGYVTYLYWSFQSLELLNFCLWACVQWVHHWLYDFQGQGQYPFLPHTSYSISLVESLQLRVPH